jgi:hypothetical protein
MNVYQRRRGKNSHMGGTEHSLGVLGGQRSAEENEQDGQNGCGQEREEGEGKKSRL